MMSYPSYPREGLFRRGFSIRNRQAELSQAFSPGLWAPDHGCLVTYQYGGVQTALLTGSLHWVTNKPYSLYKFHKFHKISLFRIHSSTVARLNLCPEEGSVCSVQFSQLVVAFRVLYIELDVV